MCDATNQRRHGDRRQRVGVVAVIARGPALLVIRRSKWVEAPGALCFPGGAIEPGESEPAALQREVQEELGAQVSPVQRLWKSVTPWHVPLVWWSAKLAPRQVLAPDAREVAAVHWLSVAQLQQAPDLLESNLAFLEALERREFSVTGLQL